MVARHDGKSSADNGGLKRRGVLTGAAWVLPAAVVSSAAPAFASSQPEVPPQEVVRGSIR